MKRILISMLALLLCVCMLSACDAAEENPTEAPTVAPTEAPTETEESIENCIIVQNAKTKKFIKILSESDSDKILSILENKQWTESYWRSIEGYNLYCPDGRIISFDTDFAGEEIYINDYENDCCTHFCPARDGESVRYEGDKETAKIFLSIVLGDQ